MKHFALESNGGGWFKQLRATKHLGVAQETVNRMRQAGWTATWPEAGSVGIVRAATFKDAVEIAGQKLVDQS